MGRGVGALKAKAGAQMLDQPLLIQEGLGRVRLLLTTVIILRSLKVEGLALLAAWAKASAQYVVVERPLQQQLGNVEVRGAVLKLDQSANSYTSSRLLRGSMLD